VDDIYGGAFRLFAQVYEKFGITVKYVDTTNIENVFNAVSDQTKLIWLETPTNPTLKISDIAAIAKIAKANNCLLCVDNTFASPAFATTTFIRCRHRGSFCHQIPWRT
jgi:cystathionine beta-lyase